MIPPPEDPLEATHTQRVLAAMRDLREFTVSQIVHRSDVNPATVRTVLQRYRSLLLETGREETGRPGGRFRRYRLTDEGHRRLTGELRSGGPIPSWRDGSVWDARFMPTGVLTAEDTVTRRYPEARTDEERQFLLGVAARDLAAAQREIDRAVGLGRDVTEARARLADVRERHTRLREPDPANSESGAGHDVADAPAQRRDVPQAERMKDVILELANKVAVAAKSNATRQRESMAEAARIFKQEFEPAAAGTALTAGGAQALVAKLKKCNDTVTLRGAEIYHFAIGPSVYAPGVVRAVAAPHGTGVERRAVEQSAGGAKEIRINAPLYVKTVAEQEAGDIPYGAPLERTLHAAIEREPAPLYG